MICARTGNKHRRLSRLKVVSWELLALPEPPAPQVTGIREVTIGPSCWQEAIAVGTAAVALAGCPSRRDGDAIAGGGAGSGRQRRAGFQASAWTLRFIPKWLHKRGLDLLLVL